MRCGSAAGWKRGAGTAACLLARAAWRSAPALELPTDHPRPAQASYRGTRYEFEIDPALVQALRASARSQGLTLFMLLLGGFNILLQRYSGQSDLRVGVPIANRNRAEVEGLIGLFVNTQVLRSVVEGQATVASLLASLKDSVLGAQAHQELPSSVWSRPSRSSVA